MADNICQKVNAIQKFSSPMSCSLLLTLLRARDFYMLHFWGNLTYCPQNTVCFKILCETLPFRTLLFIFQTHIQKFCTFQSRQKNKCLPRSFKKGPFSTVYTKNRVTLSVLRKITIFRNGENIRPYSCWKSKLMQKWFFSCNLTFLYTISKMTH